MDFLLFLLIIKLVLKVNGFKEILLNTELSNWKDWSKSSKLHLGWRQQSKAITGNLVYSICSTIEQSNQDYWLFSSLITNIDQAKSIHIRLEFTIRDCEESIALSKSKNCDNSFFLHANLLSRYEHEDNYYNTSRFRLINTVHSAYRWNMKDSRNTELRMNIWQIDWPVYHLIYEDQTPKNLLILGFRENSDCIVLHKLEISYQICPEVQKGLALLSKTSAGTNKIWSFKKPICMPGSVMNENHQTIFKTNDFYCQPNGLWSLQLNESLCYCNVGYFRLNSSICAACPLNTYKFSTGDGYCQKCPENSAALKYGQKICSCKDGFFRNEMKDRVSDRCTQPPSTPKDFYATYQTSFQVNLTWSYPIFTGFRDDVTYHLSCVHDQSVEIRPKPLLSSRRATVTKLKPSRSYLFYLYTINGVSEVAEATWKVRSTLVIKTDPLDPLVNLSWALLPDNYSGIITWEMEKKIPKHNNYFIEVLVSFQIDNERKTWNTYHTRNNSMLINNLLPAIVYDIKARIVLDDSRSPFSKELSVSVPGILHNSMKNKNQNSKITSNISWILIGNLLIISFLLLVCLVFVVFYRRQKLTYSRLTKSMPSGTWNNQISLQRRIQQNSRKSFKNMRTSNNSIYNILHSNASSESPAVLYRNKNIPMKSWSLSYRQSELMFTDDIFEHYSGYLLMNNENIPVTISKSIQISDPEKLNMLINRLHLMSNIKCHYVSKLIGYNISNSQIAFIFEQVHKGNLEDYLAKSIEEVTKEDIKKILKNILSAFVCLFKMLIKLKTISLNCFWLSDDMTCKIQILLTNFVVEDLAIITLRDFESSYISKFNDLVILISQKLAQKRDLICYFNSISNCCDQSECSWNDVMLILD